MRVSKIFEICLQNLLLLHLLPFFALKIILHTFCAALLKIEYFSFVLGFLESMLLKF